MPTYEYRCVSCGQHVEVVQSFSDEALTECGVCGGELRKVFSPVGIVFKGSGFYKTDSRSAGRPGGPKKEGEPAKEPSSTKEPSSGTSAGASSSGSAKDSKIA